MITPTQLTDRDSDLMSQAVALARKGLYTTKPNPRVGCVIIQDHTIVGQGWHEKAGEPHAEIHALRNTNVRARGAAVDGAFVSGGLADEVWAHPSPDVLGPGGRSMFVMPRIGSIDDRLRFELSDVCQTGRDLGLFYRPHSSH